MSARISSADASTLYASTANGKPGELFIINQTNGALIQDVGPLNDSSSTNYGMTGLAFQPSTGVLFGSTANNVPATAAKLVTINPATGSVTVVGGYGLASGATMGDIGFDPTTGVLYGIGTNGGAHLYSINTTTGAATLVGNSGFSFTSGGGIAIDSVSTVYGAPGLSNYGTYSEVNGAYTNIANPTKPAGGGYGAFDFDGGVLYGLNLGTPPHLVTIVPATGAVTDLGASVSNLDAIAFRPDAVPEPSTIVLLLGSTLFCMFRTGRRR